MGVQNSKVWVEKKREVLQRAEHSVNKYFVLAHGSLVDGSFKVPRNVLVVFMTTPGAYTVDPVVRKLVATEESARKLVTMDHPHFYSATYAPGEKVPDLTLSTPLNTLSNDKHMGVYKVPIDMKTPVVCPLGVRTNDTGYARRLVDQNAIASYPLRGITHNRAKLSQQAQMVGDKSLNSLPKLTEKMKVLQDKLKETFEGQERVRKILREHGTNKNKKERATKILEKLRRFEAYYRNQHAQVFQKLSKFARGTHKTTLSEVVTELATKMLYDAQNPLVLYIGSCRETSNHLLFLRCRNSNGKACRRAGKTPTGIFVHNSNSSKNYALKQYFNYQHRHRL
jgi:hypothetical protein